METRNENAEGTLIAHGDVDCTIHAEVVPTKEGGTLVRLNVTTPWDTWVGVDLTTDKARQMAVDLMGFVEGHAATSNA